LKSNKVWLLYVHALYLIVSRFHEIKAIKVYVCENGMMVKIPQLEAYIKGRENNKQVNGSDALVLQIEDKT
jgi:hypothetical protein